MSSSLLVLLFSTYTVSSKPSLYNEADSTKDPLSEYKYRFDSSSTIITTDITLNITVNESNRKSQIDHDLTPQEIESIINQSSQHYLDKLLINQHIAHKLELDPIQQILSSKDDIHDNDKLIVNMHILLYYDTIPNDEQQVIDINDLKHDIQSSSDERYGKDALHIIFDDDDDGHVKTTRSLSTTETINYEDYHTYYHEQHISLLLICIIILLFIIYIFCIGFIIIIWYLTKIRNEQKEKQKQTSSTLKNDKCVDKRINSFIPVIKTVDPDEDICHFNGHTFGTQQKQSLNLTVVPSNSTIDDHMDVMEGAENENLMNDKIIQFKHADDMSDSDQLYGFEPVIIPGLPNSDHSGDDNPEPKDNRDESIYDDKDIKITPNGDNETIGK